MELRKRKTPSKCWTPGLAKNDTKSGEEYRTAVSSAKVDDGGKAPDGTGNKSSSKKLKTNIRIGTWNTRTLRPETIQAISTTITEYNIDILGIGEHRMSGQGHFRTECGELMIFSGGKTSGQNGVGFILSKQMERALLGYNPTSDRIMTIRIQAQPVNYTFIQVYAPTSTCDEEDITSFYSQLQQTIDRTKSKDVIVIMGDFNGKVGRRQNDTEKGNVGNFGLGERNN